MVMIEVKKKDSDKVLEILFSTGRFSGFQGNKFRLEENEEIVLQKLTKASISVKIL